ncbi:S41 family peptidase [uncultured Bacteroides sp.]|uniref:S41 family peptidase n=1 Tax=uncultured Bacteroides sp. TaxID=162156 RepID=UPI0025FF0C55|nr:S41 family peptidase [uncultured Bacteroides sp.]
MKNKIIHLLLLICCLPVLTGCIREEEYANDPMGNFEQLWKIIDERYCFLDTKGIDWDAVHEKYQKLIIPTMTNDDLFSVLSEMLYTLRDGHVNLSSAKRTSYYDAWYEGYDWNYREDILYQHYLGSASKDYYTSAGMKYKIFDNNIGYIRYESFGYGVGDGNLDEVLSHLSTCNGLIIDVRDNGGGNLTYSTRIAARFTNKKVLTGYIQHKTGTGHNDFSAMEPIYLEPSNSIRWQKKVVILTNRRCYSATNDFVNLMRSIEDADITQVGDWTGGGSGLPFSSELPNGWSIRFSASPHFDKNKQPLEEGIEPDIKIDMTEKDQLEHKDTLIEKAFEILSE